MAGCHPGGPFFVDNTRPFAQRHHGMSLDTVKPQDVPRGKVMYVKDEDRSLKTTDIEHAQPVYHHLKYLDKPDLSKGCTNPTHAGGQARSYYAPMDRRPRDLSLTTADIELAQPKVVKRKGNRHTDPVCPNYELPSHFKREPTPPRFHGRHTHDISDIEHSCPKIRHPERNYVRDPNDSRDIEGTMSNFQERQMRGGGPPRERADRSMNVQDIMDVRKIRPRETNPLNPVYKVPANRSVSLHAHYTEEKMQGFPHPQVEPTYVGEIHGSRPRKLQWDNGEPQLSLLREDIAGTVPQRWVGSVPHNIYDPPEVRPLISFHDPHDIAGAQVGSLKKGIEGSRRCVNPLNPKYPMLDGDAKPHAAPVLEAERGRAHPSHPMLQAQSRINTVSLPDLRRGGTGQLPNLPGSSAGASMRRDASAGALGIGSTQRIPIEGAGVGLFGPGTAQAEQLHPEEMSRRSGGSSEHGNYRQEQYGGMEQYQSQMPDPYGEPPGAYS